MGHIIDDEAKVQGREGIEQFMLLVYASAMMNTSVINEEWRQLRRRVRAERRHININESRRAEGHMSARQHCQSPVFAYRKHKNSKAHPEYRKLKLNSCKLEPARNPEWKENEDSRFLGRQPVS